MPEGIVYYLFLSGVSGGSFLTAFACDMLFTPYSAAHPFNFRSASWQTKPPACMGYFVAPACAAAASLFLLSTFTHPDRAFAALLHPFSSVTSFGACSLACFFLCSVLLLFEMNIECHSAITWIPGADMKAFRTITALTKLGGALFAMLTISYTGLLLGSLRSYEFWNSWLLPCLFVLSSLSTGAAALVLANLCDKEGSGLPDNRFLAIANILSVVEFVVLVCFISSGVVFGSNGARLPSLELLNGEMAGAFWLGVVGLSFALPWASRVLQKKAPSLREPLKLASSLSALAGGFCLRWCVVYAAVPTLTVVTLW